MGGGDGQLVGSLGPRNLILVDEEAAEFDRGPRRDLRMLDCQRRHVRVPGAFGVSPLLEQGGEPGHRPGGELLVATSDGPAVDLLGLVQIAARLEELREAEGGAGAELGVAGRHGVAVQALGAGSVALLLQQRAQGDRGTGDRLRIGRVAGLPPGLLGGGQLLARGRDPPGEVPDPQGDGEGTEHVAADVLGGLGTLVSAGPVRLDPTDRRVRVQVDVDAVVRTQLEVKPRLGGNLPQRDDPLVEDGTRGGVPAERAAPDQVVEACPVVVGDEVGTPDALLPVAAHRADVLPEPEGKQPLVERRHHQPGAEVDLGALALRDRCRFGCRHRMSPDQGTAVL